MSLALAVLLLCMLCRSSMACCHNMCSGHGTCSAGTCSCTCYSQFTGADCSLRSCPVGLQWFGDASATDTIHDVQVECSGVGMCDRSTGQCECNDGFTGMACERLACPGDCNDHGRCVSLAEAGDVRDDWHFFNEVTYTQWDSDKIYGCKCDYGYTGHDCSLRECVRGDDPETAGGDEEVQLIDCTCSTACTGNFYLTFRGQTTHAIAHDASAETVKARLEELRTIRGVAVSFSVGSTVCGDAGSVTSVTFTYETGDVPALIPSVGSLASSGATVLLEVYHDGQFSAVNGAFQSVVGSKEDAECNNRGVCITSTGLCSCAPGFDSSDGAGNEGTLGDCGYGTASACPGSLSCSGNGVCGTDYVCTCVDGYTGADCSLRTCPKGKAWFAEPGRTLPGYVTVNNGDTAVTTTADLTLEINRGDTIVIDGNELTVSTDTSDAFTSVSLPLSSAYPGSSVTTNTKAVRNPQDAHYEVECSARGSCDRTTGECSCDSGFEGGACQFVSCPTAESGAVCSGHGKCFTLAQWAEDTLDNGVATSRTYGVDITNTNTWDHDMMRGCKCDTSLMQNGMYDFIGTDCSLLECVEGEDPSFAGDYEVQDIQCTATGGTVAFTFREETTESMVYNAGVEELTSKLEALDTISSVSITLSTGSQICDTTVVTSTVTFNHELGDLPLIEFDDSGLTGTVSVVTNTDGTREALECSDHGLCNRESGICECFAGYVSSDGNRARGTRSDCAFRDALYTG